MSLTVGQGELSSEPWAALVKIKPEDLLPQLHQTLHLASQDNGELSDNLSEPIRDRTEVNCPT